MAKGAVVLGLATLPLAGGIAYAVRGRDAAISTALALAIAVANFAVAAAVSALAGRRSAVLSALVGLPSYAVRMALILAGLALLKGASFVDRPVFAAAFGAGVVAVLVFECVLWARTPWISMTLSDSAVPPPRRLLM